jgi:putative SOS response-associated peptidase YedK
VSWKLSCTVLRGGAVGNDGSLLDTTTRGGKEPYFISAADGGVLGIAGIWDRWKDPAGGEPVTSCTLIVTAANAFARAIYERMPVLLERPDFEAWLGGNGGVELLRPAAESRLRMWPVSKRVNRAGAADDDPTLTDKAAR